MALCISGALGTILAGGLYGTVNFLSLFLGLAGYVLAALGLYSMARWRNLSHGWLSWVPVGNAWLLGSFSDQYQYVVKGKNTSRRNVLLVLSILSAVFTTVIFCVFGAAVGEILRDSFRGLPEEMMEERMIAALLHMLGLLIIMLPLTIARYVFRLMALYDLFRSCDPETASMFLILSILFPMTTPFFLFFNRGKEKGMPPRKGSLIPVIPAPEAAPENRETPEEACQSSAKAPEYL